MYLAILSCLTILLLNKSTLASLYIHKTIIFCFSKCKLERGQNIHTPNTKSKNLFCINAHRLEMYRLPAQSDITFINKLLNNIKTLKVSQILKVQKTLK